MDESVLGSLQTFGLGLGPSGTGTASIKDVQVIKVSIVPATLKVNLKIYDATELKSRKFIHL